MDIEPGNLREGTVVVIRAFDDIPEHRFVVTEVYEDCVGGQALDGPFSGAYGEPSFNLIKTVESR